MLDVARPAAVVGEDGQEAECHGVPVTVRLKQQRHPVDVERRVRREVALLAAADRSGPPITACRSSAAGLIGLKTGQRAAVPVAEAGWASPTAATPAAAAMTPPPTSRSRRRGREGERAQRGGLHMMGLSLSWRPSAPGRLRSGWAPHPSACPDRRRRGRIGRRARRAPTPTIDEIVIGRRARGVGRRRASRSTPTAVCRVGSHAIALVGRERGKRILSWSLRDVADAGIESSGELDGLATQVSQTRTVRAGRPPASAPG